MTRQWRRRSADWRETVGAAALGAGLGVAAFYVVRLLLAREEVSPPERRPGEVARADEREDRDREEP